MFPRAQDIAVVGSELPQNCRRLRSSKSITERRSGNRGALLVDLYSGRGTTRADALRYDTALFSPEPGVASWVVELDDAYSIADRCSPRDVQIIKARAEVATAKNHRSPRFHVPAAGLQYSLNAHIHPLDGYCTSRLQRKTVSQCLTAVDTSRPLPSCIDPAEFRSGAQATRVRSSGSDDSGTRLGWKRTAAACSQPIIGKGSSASTRRAAFFVQNAPTVCGQALDENALDKSVRASSSEVLHRVELWAGFLEQPGPVPNLASRFSRLTLGV